MHQYFIHCIEHNGTGPNGGDRRLEFNLNHIGDAYYEVTLVKHRLFFLVFNRRGEVFLNRRVPEFVITVTY